MLKLNELKMHNWCNLQGNKEISFSDNFNLIHGDNGKGKTSIVSAISILLLNRYDGSFENYINDKSTDASIELDFNLNNDNYLASLKLKKAKGTSSERHLIKNGTEIATGEDCAKELDKVLPSFLTSYSLIYRQSGEDKVTDCSDSERRDLLTQLVAIDYSEKVEQFITPNIEEIKSKITETEKELFALENKTYNFSEERSIPKKVPEAEIENLKAKVKLWENNETNKQRKTQLEEKVIVAKQGLDNLKNKYNKDNILENEKKQIEQITQSTDNQVSQIEKSINDEKLNSKIRMQGLLDSKSKNLQALQTIKVLNVPVFDENQITEINKTVTTQQTNKGILLKNIESLKQGICPVCGGNCEHKLSDYQKEFDELEKSLTLNLEEQTRLSNLQKNYKETIEANQKAESDKISLQNEIKNTDLKINNEKSSIVSLIQSLKEKENLLKSGLESKIEAVKTDVENQLKSADEIINQAKTNIANFQAELSSIEVLDNLENCSSKLSEAENKNVEIDKIIAYNKAVQEQNKLLTDQKAEDETKKLTVTNQLIDLKKSLANYNLSAEIMNKTYPAWKLEKDLKDIENKTNIFIEDIYKPLFVEFTANKNSLKMVYGDGDRKLPIKRLSGAEKQIVNLAVENVFNQQQNLSCLILDESDSAMDKNNKETFFSTLVSLQDRYEQVLVITHSDEIKSKLQALGANIILL